MKHLKCINEDIENFGVPKTLMTAVSYMIWKKWKKLI